LALLAILAIQSRFEQRPEVASYLLLAWMIEACAALRFDQALPRRTLVGLFLIQVIWTNVHGFFALGPLVILAKVGARAFTSPRPSRREVGRAAAAIAVVLAATFASPFGADGWRTVVGYASFGGRLNDLIRELAPPEFHLTIPPLTAFWAALAVSIPLGVFALVRRRDVFAVMLALGGAALAVSAVRNLPLFFVMVAPLWAHFGEFKLSRAARVAAAGVQAGLCALIAVAFVAGAYGNAIGLLGTFGVRLEPASYPVSAARYLVEADFRGRIFNDSYDGGYLEFEAPGAVVTGDSYFADVPRTREFLDAIRDPRRLAELDRRLHFDALLINVENQAVYDAARTSGEFHLAHVDAHRALFRRGPIEPVRGTYYEGADLRHWANAFGPNAWLAAARRHRDAAHVGRILSDLAAAPAIPAATLDLALAFAEPRRACELIALIRPLRERAFGDAEDLRRIDRALIPSVPCAP
jgi:hypothetical protein